MQVSDAQPAAEVAATESSDVQTRVEDSRASSATNSPVPPETEESDFYDGNNDSQSSLGVSTVQGAPMNQDDEDMDERCPPVMTVPSEVLIHIFSRLPTAADLFNVMLTNKHFAKNAVHLLWHRPAITSLTFAKIADTLSLPIPYFHYSSFIKRLNLASMGGNVTDSSMASFLACTRIERLTLTHCHNLSDLSLVPLIRANHHLLALDITNVIFVTDATVNALAESCPKLQGLNVTNCKRVTNASMTALAQSCRFLKRVKLNECVEMEDDTVMAFAENCRNLLEIDLYKCANITTQPVTALLAQGNCLRELRLFGCELIDDSTFLNIPRWKMFDHLRILDLTSCSLITDRAVEKIIDTAPKLRNLVLAKCKLITDRALYAISKLGRNLHFLHLGHCSNITDDAVKKLIACCNRIRYIDMGCCANLTDESITRLSTLPKLKRVGLVKCQGITDRSVFALATMGVRRRQVIDKNGVATVEEFRHHPSSLERVHLSYCTSLTMRSVLKLLNASPRLTHLSLTGILAFIRDDLAQFCRDAPSGPGVVGLRNHLNTHSDYTDVRQSLGMTAQPTIVPAQIPAAIADEHDGIEDDDDDKDLPAATGGGTPPPPPAAPLAPQWLVLDGQTLHGSDGSEDVELQGGPL